MPPAAILEVMRLRNMFVSLRHGNRRQLNAHLLHDAQRSSAWNFPMPTAEFTSTWFAAIRKQVAISAATSESNSPQEASSDTWSGRLGTNLEGISSFVQENLTAEPGSLLRGRTIVDQVPRAMQGACDAGIRTTRFGNPRHVIRLGDRQTQQVNQQLGQVPNLSRSLSSCVPSDAVWAPWRAKDFAEPDA